MLLLGLISWWYGAGWLQLMQRALARVQRVLDFFSVQLLLKSLFAPYRQISAGRVQGSLNVQMRAWFDRQISRVIGAVVRLIVVVVGLLAVLVVFALGLICIFLWPFLPVLPFIIGVVTLGATR